MRRRSAAGGFSMLELVVVVALVGTLLVVALGKLAGYVTEAERVAVLTLEGEIRNVLVMATAQRILDRDGPAVEALADTNPMELMLETPVNYVGARDPAAARDVPARHWYFDEFDRRLVYRGGAGLTGGGDRAEIRYAVVIAFADRDSDGRYSPAVDEFHGVRLRRSGGESWLRAGDAGG